MARTFSKNASNYATLGAGAMNALMDGAAAISVSVFAKAAGLTSGTPTAANRLLAFQIAGGNSIVILWQDAGSGNANVLAGGRSQEADGFQSCVGDEEFAYDAWHHIGLVMNYTTDRILVYVDGVLDKNQAVNFGSDTFVPGSPTLHDVIGGDDETPTTDRQFDGDISEVHVFSGVLGATEFAAIAGADDPDTVTGGGITRIAGWRLLGDDSPEPDNVGSTDLTLVGSIPAATHPFGAYNGGGGGTTGRLVGGNLLGRLAT